MVKIQHTYHSVHDVPYHLCEQLEKASFGPDGLLYKSFREIKFEGHPYDATVVVFLQHSDVVGWGMLLNYNDYIPEADYTLMLYVHESHRKQGIGRKITTKLLAYADSGVFVWPSKDSGGNTGFFHRLNHPKVCAWGRCRA